MNHAPAEHSESEERERYRELLEELRTIIPGVQVLFAFLLTVPFASRFSNVDHLGRVVFAISLMAVASATFLFIAPTAYHRLVGHRDRRARLRFGVRTALVGLGLLALSIICAIFVVVRFIFDWRVAGVLSGATAAMALTLWYLYPLWKRRGDPREIESS